MKNIDLVITPGDPQGIGPEVTAKAILHLSGKIGRVSIFIHASKESFKRERLFLRKSLATFVEPPKETTPGYQSAWAIQSATRFVMHSPRTRALVTGPISKERIREAGFKYSGHTDLLADLTGTPEVTMMLANETFRVALVTNHCPLKDVSQQITSKRLERAVQHSIAYCKVNLGKQKPKIAILGLNPHCGEGGILGQEDTLVIAPTIKALSRKFPDIRLSGPFPADSFFAIESGRSKRRRHDIIIAQYHDQGLIPVKLSGFSRSMNMTLGLPIIRTSVDHGTAFDIAGKNQADPGSMIYAIENAILYLNQRSNR
ncbi:MAG: 4-hydroxythreonine-4-phosphate dehydrogenase PdxA [Bdellovibrionales bacterium]|nr:4-hydroxythreonine-4-phosphate dehydrogenase PdxA [Bdellovibrionales bacterium]